MFILGYIDVKLKTKIMLFSGYIKYGAPVSPEVGHTVVFGTLTHSREIRCITIA